MAADPTYGCFTTMRVEPDGVRGWSEHVDRLVRDSGVLFDRPVAPEEIRRAAVTTLAGAERPALLRLVVTARDHTLASPGGRDLVVTGSLRPAHEALLPPLAVGLVEHRRTLPGIKHLGLTPELLARRRARAAGHDDALLTHGGLVTEGPTWALLLVLGGRLVTPYGALPSVTVTLLEGEQPIARRWVGADEVRRASAAMALNAGWGVREIAAIDGEPLPGGPWAARLQAAYDRVAPEAFA